MNKNFSKIIILSNFSLGCCPLLHLLLLLLLSSTSTTTFYTFFLPTIGKNVLMSLVHLINLCNFSINPFFFFSLFSSSSSSSTTLSYTAHSSYPLNKNMQINLVLFINLRIFSIYCHRCLLPLLLLLLLLLPTTPPPPLPSHTMHIPFIHYQQECFFNKQYIKKSGLKMRIYNRADLESFL